MAAWRLRVDTFCVRSSINPMAAHQVNKVAMKATPAPKATGSR